MGWANRANTPAGHRARASEKQRMEQAVFDIPPDANPPRFSRIQRSAFEVPGPGKYEESQGHCFVQRKLICHKFKQEDRFKGPGGFFRSDEPSAAMWGISDPQDQNRPPSENGMIEKPKAQIRSHRHGKIHHGLVFPPSNDRTFGPIKNQSQKKRKT